MDHFDMKAVAPTVLLLFTLVMAAATVVWMVALRRFLRLLATDYPDTFQRLGCRTAGRFDSGFGAWQRTARLYRFLSHHAHDGGAADELRCMCRRLRLLFIFRWSAFLGFAVALLVVGILFTSAHDI